MTAVMMAKQGRDIDPMSIKTGSPGTRAADMSFLNRQDHGRSFMMPAGH